MLMYDYIVCYIFDREGYLTPCSGTMQLSRKKKIKTFNEVNELANEIEERIDGASNLSINNLILLGRNRH